MMMPCSVGTLLLLAGLSAHISGHAHPQVKNQSARSTLANPIVLYSPKPMPDTATLTSVKDDLADLLKERNRPVGLLFGSHAFTRVDINICANLNELGALLAAGNKVYTFRYDNTNDPGSPLKRIEYKTISVLLDRIEIAPRVAFPFREILDGPITVTQSKDDESYPYAIHLEEQLSFLFHRKDLADAKRMADDLFFLQQHLPKQDDLRAVQAQALATQYRALKTKPPVSEEQRRFIVQANAMNQQKDYGRALELYQKALDLEPLSYPSAYFNMALLSAQLGRFRQAIASMKQYLLLEPEANDARSAQDKIYEWEIMLGK